MSDLPKMNTELCHDLVDWIENKSGTSPEIPLWNQGAWSVNVKRHFQINAFLPSLFRDWYQRNQQEENFCGTAFCLAGMALQMTGNLQTTQNGESVPADTVIGFNENVSRVHVLDSPNFWTKAGAAVLGLTMHEANDLFEGTNRVPTIKTLLTKFAKARGLSETF